MAGSSKRGLQVGAACLATGLAGFAYYQYTAGPSLELSEQSVGALVQPVAVPLNKHITEPPVPETTEIIADTSDATVAEEPEVVLETDSADTKESDPVAEIPSPSSVVEDSTVESELVVEPPEVVVDTPEVVVDTPEPVVDLTEPVVDAPSPASVIVEDTITEEPVADLPDPTSGTVVEDISTSVVASDSETVPESDPIVTETIVESDPVVSETVVASDTVVPETKSTALLPLSYKPVIPLHIFLKIVLQIILPILQRLFS